MATTTRIVFTGLSESIKTTLGVMEQNSTPAPAPTPRKRQRLTHLTAEEKMLRRKLKNRVAAQTARDRKKAHMDSMEETLGMTQLANEELVKENEALKQENERLVKENQELRQRLGLVSDIQMETKTDKDVVVIKKEVGSPESAALNAPPQQSDVLLGLLENLDSQDPAHCHLGRGSYETSQGQDGAYPVVGPSTEELESLKELIRFDHEYVKRPPIPTPTIIIEQEKMANSVAAKPKPQEPAISLDVEESVVDLTSGEDSPASALEFCSNMLPNKAEAALQDMLVSLKDASLSLDTKDTTVPNLLSIDDGVFDCDISDMLGWDSDVTSCDTKSETGSSADSAFSDTPASPFSDEAMSPNLGDSVWEESFTDLFPSLDYL